MRARFPLLRGVVIIGSDDILDMQYLIYCRNKLHDSIGLRLSSHFTNFPRSSSVLSLHNTPRKQRMQNKFEFELALKQRALLKESQAGQAPLLIGTKDAFFLNLKTMDLYYAEGYVNKDDKETSNSALGQKDFTLPGRCVSRELLDLSGWQPWDNTLNKGLDGSMHRLFSYVASYRKKERIWIDAIHSRRLGMIQLSLKVVYRFIGQVLLCASLR